MTYRERRRLQPGDQRQRGYDAVHEQCATVSGRRVESALLQPRSRRQQCQDATTRCRAALVQFRMANILQVIFVQQLWLAWRQTCRQSEQTCSWGIFLLPAPSGPHWDFAVQPGHPAARAWTMRGLTRGQTGSRTGPAPEDRAGTARQAYRPPDHCLLTRNPRRAQAHNTPRMHVAHMQHSQVVVC